MNNLINLEMLPDLEAICATCGGGRVKYESESDTFPDCQTCGGSGFVPTSIGARILDLIRHNSRVTVSAELRVSSAR